MTPEQPHAYPRRILLAVSGLTPQVVTETLYALTRQQPPFVPTEVHVITTAEGATRLRLALLSGEPGWFARLCRDYELPAIAFDESRIHVLRDAAGQMLDDIRTPQDNQQAADQISQWVRSLTADPEAALHVSLAGGRKTMGYYLGYALSLFGRPQDRLSHVLVSEPFESSWEFFYPTPYERIIPARDGKLADCRQAMVTLAEIPFVRLREGLPPRLLAGEASLSEVVRAAQRALLPPRLVLDAENRRAWADDLPIDLSATEFALVLWLARRALGGAPEVCWHEAAAAREFLAVAAEVMQPMSAEYERCEKAVTERLDDPKLLRDYFEPHKSRINAGIEAALGPSAAQRYLIQRGGRTGSSHYFLALGAEQIILAPAPAAAATSLSPAGAGTALLQNATHHGRNGALP